MSRKKLIEHKTGWNDEVDLGQMFRENLGLYIAGILGGLLGHAMYGGTTGIVLSLPFILVYIVIKALIQGKALWWAGYTHEMDGHHAQYCTRKDHPFRFWLVIVLKLLLAWWMLSFI